LTLTSMCMDCTKWVDPSFSCQKARVREVIHSNWQRITADWTYAVISFHNALWTHGTVFPNQWWVHRQLTASKLTKADLMPFGTTAQPSTIHLVTRAKLFLDWSTSSCNQPRHACAAISSVY
jgi:hypothetical protein